MDAETHADRAAMMVVGALAFALYVFAAAPAPTLLDSAELAEAAFGLGVAHPPGEPIAALWGKLFTLLPAGSISFRVALGQAAAAALAAVLLMRLAWWAVAPFLSVGARPAARVVVGALAILFAVSPGVIVSAARPEVYALQAALSLLAVEMVMRAAASGDPRPALAAAAVIGLGLGVHPLLAGLLGVGAVVGALPLVRRLPVRLTGWSVLVLVLGASALLYVPVRAAAHPALSWGDAHSWNRLVWLLSARTFAAKAGIIHTNTSVADAPFMLIEELSLPAALLAVGGLYVLVRRQATRHAGLVLAITAGASVTAAAIAGMDHSNPDIRGYLMGAVACLAVLAAVGVLVALDVVLRRRRVGLAVATVVAAAVLVRAPSGLAQASRRDSTFAAAAGARMLSTLPPRSVWLTSDFQTAFLAGYLRTAEGWRPDVSWVHLGFVGGPGYVERVAGTDASLGHVLRAFQQQTPFSALIRTFDRTSAPVRFESDLRLGDAVVAQLRPDGPAWRLAEPGSGRDEDTAAADAVLAVAPSLDREELGYLAWRIYSDAQVACRAGLPEAARSLLNRLLALRPNDSRARSLVDDCPAARRAP